MQIDAATATLLAAAIGALSSGVTAVLILLITKRSEERRHLRELAVKAALENWQAVSNAAVQAGQPRMPLDVFLVHMFKLAEALSSRDLAADTLASKLRDVQRFTDIAVAEARRYSEELPKEKT